MATATELLSEAQKLTKIAEDLDAKVAARVEKFEAEIAADRAKAAEAKGEAARKIAEAARAMGGTAPVAAAPRRRGSRTSVEPRAIIDVIAAERTPVGAADIRRALDVDVSSNTLSNKLAALVEAGKIKKTGERRGTRYSLA
jgi:hypothetical protein